MPTLNLRLDKDLARRLEAESRREVRTPAGQAIYFIEQALNMRSRWECAPTCDGPQGGGR